MAPSKHSPLPHHHHLLLLQNPLCRPSALIFRTCNHVFPHTFLVRALQQKNVCSGSADGIERECDAIVHVVVCATSSVSSK